MEARKAKKDPVVSDQAGRLMPVDPLGTKKDPVVSDQAGRLMPVDPLGINSSPDHVKRKFNVNSAREDVVRQRAYEIYEQHGRQEGYALDHWLQAEQELT